MSEYRELIPGYDSYFSCSTTAGKLGYAGTAVFIRKDTASKVPKQITVGNNMKQSKINFSTKKKDKKIEEKEEEEKEEEKEEESEEAVTSVTSNYTIEKISMDFEGMHDNISTRVYSYTLSYTHTPLPHCTPTPIHPYTPTPLHL